MNVCAFCHSFLRDYERIAVHVAQVCSSDQYAAGLGQNSD